MKKKKKKKKKKEKVQIRWSQAGERGGKWGGSNSHSYHFFGNISSMEVKSGVKNMAVVSTTSPTLPTTRFARPQLWMEPAGISHSQVHWKPKVGKCCLTVAPVIFQKHAVTRIRTGVAAATTQSTNHYTITARYRPGRAPISPWMFSRTCSPGAYIY
ncbi:hypothetical protein F2P81_005271 [Scophthalmus maximus]|uniref:Uncharacterized protein n=1 Tax=Scophthalmus maximus TaxID=52904 RepID=A0A6A4TA55_SCOMX|nr:hypothetical protein F2P81_005271 [Scophthalmus maximus]